MSTAPHKRPRVVERSLHDVTMDGDRHPRGTLFVPPAAERSRTHKEWKGPRPGHTYRGGEPRTRPCDILKVAKLRRDMSRRDLDAERFAVWCLLHDKPIPRGFTEGELLPILEAMTRDART